MSNRRRITKEFQVWVEMNGEWYPMTQFDEIEDAVAWMTTYDSEGTVPMKLKNLWEHREVDLVQWSLNYRSESEEERLGDWKKEGF